MVYLAISLSDYQCFFKCFLCFHLTDDPENKTFRHPEETRQRKFNFFQCNDTRGLPTTLLCDGHRHCLDGEDEENCGEISKCVYGPSLTEIQSKLSFIVVVFTSFFA